MGKHSRPLLQTLNSFFSSKTIGLCAVYFLTAKLGLRMDAVSGFATLVWPPTGISLAALLLYGSELWPGIALGALLVNWSVGAPMDVACGIAIGNTLEAVAGAYGLRSLTKFQNSLERLRDVLGLLGIAALGATLLSATIGVSSLWLGDVIPATLYWSTWKAWWVGDMLGVLVITPVLLLWAHRPRLKLHWPRLLELGLLTLSLILINGVVFWDIPKIEAKYFPTGYLVFPPLIWASLRFGQRGTVTATFVTSCLAILGTARGFSPYTGYSLSESLLFLQLFFGVIATSSMILAAVVTERAVQKKQLETAYQDIQRKTQELARSNTELEHFAYMASHDLQEPLRKIAGFTELLAMRYRSKLDSQADKFIDYIVDGAGRMQSLIKALLTYSQVGREEKLKLVPTDLSILLKQVLSDLEPAIRESEAQITFGPLPKVTVSPPQIIQLFLNLISNAIKFRGPESLHIHIAAKEKDRQWLLSVQDNGIGIDPQYREQVFEMFKRLHAKKEYAGSGLGLAICKKIVTTHGGRIWVDSQPGQGATFYFTLPKDVPQASPLGATSRPLESIVR